MDPESTTRAPAQSAWREYLLTKKAAAVLVLVLIAAVLLFLFKDFGKPLDQREYTNEAERQIQQLENLQSSTSADTSLQERHDTLNVLKPASAGESTLSADEKLDKLRKLQR